MDYKRGDPLISIEKGTVRAIIKTFSKRKDLLVEIDGREEKAVNYNELTGEVQVGDQVILNTTAVKLGLGTGGYHFVLHNLANNPQKMPLGGAYYETSLYATAGKGICRRGAG